MYCERSPNYLGFRILFLLVIMDLVVLLNVNLGKGLWFCHAGACDADLRYSGRVFVPLWTF